ncbi:MAG: hypothetical protein FWG49_02715 [Leptospirales bacterium]|nr:hypothetical protein [Leptospirales bacterium]
MYDKNSKYSFLNEKLNKEAHIEEILSEIESKQANWLKKHSDELATIENLSESRNIKIPFTPKRLANIRYLIDLLVKNHPTEIRSVFSYKFSTNPANNNLAIEEKAEYTVMMKDSQYNHLQMGRDKESTKSLNELIKNFRLFNLTKLVEKSKNRSYLTHLIKEQLGTNIFTLKYSTINKNGLAIEEDFCFHRDNYDTVKTRLDLEEIKRIIASHEQIINRYLKNYGILNSYINDYRDNKLDYILNILSNHLNQSFDKTDEIKVKNFRHLRECILKVDKLLDPAIMLDSEILNYLHEKFTTTDSDIVSLFPNMTIESLSQWESEKIYSGKLIAHNYNNIKYFIDPVQFIDKYESLISSVVDGIEPKAGEINYDNNNVFIIDLLTDAGTHLLGKDQNAQRIFNGTENVEKLKDLINKYLHHKQRLKAMHDVAYDSDKKGLFSSIKNIISSIINLFKGKEKNKQSDAKKTDKTNKSNTEISKETRDLYEEISLHNSILTPISDFIEIKPDNEYIIEKLIAELRSTNLKIVIPMYNARKHLYIKRSQKYLISDIEYLLVDPAFAASPEIIYDYIDSIKGFRLKEDTLTGNALFSIEKYLFSIYRQNKEKLEKLKKQKSKKK